jgi:hypothetical protein
VFSQVEDGGVNNYNYNSQNNFTVMKYWDVDDECPVMKYNNSKKTNRVNNTFEGVRSPNNGRSKGNNRMCYSCGRGNVIKRNINGSNASANVNVNCLLLFKKSNIDKMKKEIATKTKKLRHYEEEEYE